jgi:hypothetical protein
MLTAARIRHACHLARLTLYAWIVLAAVDIAQRAGFAHVHRQIRRCRVNPAGVLASPEDVVWSVDEACVWYVRRATCLQRSAVATWLLRRHGVAADLVIGYRPAPFESHAWVEVDGLIVNDRPQYQRAFTVLDRI